MFASTAAAGTTMSRSKRYFNEREAAAMCGWSVSSLRNWRSLGRGPAYCKVGKSVRYLEADLFAFMERCRVVLNAH
jgi:predicted DNA-binding transcriptional regulator AlpA